MILLFKSAVDGWFYAVIVVTAMVTLASLVSVWRSGSTVGVIAVSIAFLLAVAMPLWLLFSTHYIVDAETLRIRSGPFRWDIPRSSIVDVRSSRSAVSSPALSLDRLEIRYDGHRSVLVSPEDRQGFLEALCKDGSL